LKQLTQLVIDGCLLLDDAAVKSMNSFRQDMTHQVWHIGNVVTQAVGDTSQTTGIIVGVAQGFAAG